MRILFALALLCSLKPIIGQNQKPISLGIGFAIAANPYQFEDFKIPENLYQNQGLSEKWQDEKVQPFFFKPDYGLYHFICLEQSPSYFKILVNDSAIGYLPRDSSFYFKTWEEILVESSVQRLTKDNPILIEPKIQSQELINLCDIELLKVLSLVERNGEHWLQIEFSPDCEPYPEEWKLSKRGWIKWRDANNFLVTIRLL